MVLYPAHLENKPGSLPLRELAGAAHDRGIPVLVDAAYLNDPPSRMSSFTAAGADLVCFSAKYFWGPNSGGFLAGRRDLVDAVAGVDFTRYESGKYLAFGRPFKLDRQIIVGTVVALEQWMAMDHTARWAGYARKVEFLRDCLRGISGITATPQYFTMDERLIASPVNCLALSFSPESRWTAERLSADLMAGEPSIATVALGDTLVIAVDTVLDGQERAIAERVSALLRK